MRSHRRRNPSISEISLAPFIDVIFLLLCFFVVTTRFDDMQKLAIQLPESVTETVIEEQKFLEVSIDQIGVIGIGSIEIVDGGDEQIASVLYEYPRNQHLLIKADQSALHGRVVQLMDVAGQIGFSKISIASVEKETRQETRQ